jgi:lysozyme family protein
MSGFERGFALTVGQEGGYDCNPVDRGNWTGGAVGLGQLRGTRFGISAASYPTLDIAGLSLAQAQAIYRGDYWQRVAGDLLPDAVAIVAFDIAVNQGVGTSARLLQAALGVAVDGVIGPATTAAARGCADLAALLDEMGARRALAYAGTAGLASFGLGWMRRVFAVRRAAAA